MDKYPFNVIIYRQASGVRDDKRWTNLTTTAKTFQTLGAAQVYALEQSRQRFVSRVELAVTLATFREGKETV